MSSFAMIETLAGMTLDAAGPWRAIASSLGAHLPLPIAFAIDAELARFLPALVLLAGGLLELAGGAILRPRRGGALEVLTLLLPAIAFAAFLFARGIGLDVSGDPPGAELPSDGFELAYAAVVLGGVFLLIVRRSETGHDLDAEQELASDSGLAPERTRDRSTSAAILLSSAALLAPLGSMSLLVLFAAVESARLVLWAGRVGVSVDARHFVVEALPGLALLLALAFLGAGGDGISLEPVQGGAAARIGSVLLLAGLLGGAALGPIGAIEIGASRIASPSRGASADDDLLAKFRSAVLPAALVLLAYRAARSLVASDPEQFERLVLTACGAAACLLATAGGLFALAARPERDRRAMELVCFRIALLLVASASALASPENAMAETALILVGAHLIIATLAPASGSLERRARARRSRPSARHLVLSLSSAGAPGTLGFWARWLALRVTVENGLWLLAILGGLLWAFEAVAALARIARTDAIDPVSRGARAEARGDEVPVTSAIAAAIVIVLGVAPSLISAFE